MPVFPSIQDKIKDRHQQHHRKHADRHYRLCPSGCQEIVDQAQQYDDIETSPYAMGKG